MRYRQNIDHQLAFRRQRRVERKINRHFNVFFNNVTLLFGFGLVQYASFNKARFQQLNRVGFFAHFVNFFALSVFGWVRHRMTAIAISQHFENIRTLAGANMGDGFFACRMNRFNIHAIDLRAGNAETGTALR